LGTLNILRRLLRGDLRLTLTAAEQLVDRLKDIEPRTLASFMKKSLGPRKAFHSINP
jgi:hypothetical protein